MSGRGAAAGKEEQERQEEQEEQQEDDPYRSRWRSALHFVSTLSWAPDWHTSRRQLCAVDSGSSGSSAGSAERLILLSYNVNFGLPGRSREGQKVLQGVREVRSSCVFCCVGGGGLWLWLLVGLHARPPAVSRVNSQPS
jgi:hypothetical protein